MDERNFTVIKTEQKAKTEPAKRQTNPIAKKFLEFHKDNLAKFSVKDLFKK